MLNKYCIYLSESVFFAWWQAFTCISHAFSGLMASLRHEEACEMHIKACQQAKHACEMHIKACHQAKNADSEK